MKIGNIPEKEFKIMIGQMIQDLGKRMKKIRCKKCLPKPKRTKGQTEMNNTLERINSRITEAEEWLNDHKWWKSWVAPQAEP